MRCQGGSLEGSENLVELLISYNIYILIYIYVYIGHFYLELLETLDIGHFWAINMFKLWRKWGKWSRNMRFSTANVGESSELLSIAASLRYECHGGGVSHKNFGVTHNGIRT